MDDENWDGRGATGGGTGLSTREERLIHGVRTSATAAVDAALADGADPNHMGEDTMWRPLLTEAVKITDEVKSGLLMAALLGAGADVDCRGPGGVTALMAAAGLRGSCAVRARLLLAAGADPDITDDKGATALAYAVGAGSLANAAELMKAGADVSAADNAGRSPLHLACEKRDAAMAKVLLAAGARTDAVNVRGATPLDVTESPEWGPGSGSGLREVMADALSDEMAKITATMKMGVSRR